VSTPHEPTPSPSPTDPLVAHYFVDDGLGAIGPITGEKLKEMIEAGAIARAAQVNRVGTEAWASVMALPIFASSFKEEAAPQFAPTSPGRAAAAGEQERVYATFWTRLQAYLIDMLILGAGGFALGVAIGVIVVAIYGAEGAKEILARHEILFDGLGVLLGLVYQMHFMSGPWQATPGKRIMGIYVIRTSGARISPLFAVGRHLAHLLSALPLGYGFVMIFWSKEHQALHDMICKSRVVEGKL
jgi:uncharacterized RDD family membrane protein YckC